MHWEHKALCSALVCRRTIASLQNHTGIAAPDHSLWAPDTPPDPNIRLTHFHDLPHTLQDGLRAKYHAFVQSGVFRARTNEELAQTLERTIALVRQQILLACVALLPHDETLTRMELWMSLENGFGRDIVEIAKRMIVTQRLMARTTNPKARATLESLGFEHLGRASTLTERHDLPAYAHLAERDPDTLLFTRSEETAQENPRADTR